MKYSFLVFVILNCVHVYSQKNWVISARSIGLPAMYCNYEVHYSSKGKFEKHYFKNGTTDCFPKSHKKGRKSKKQIGFKSYEFLHEHSSDSEYWMPIHYIDTTEIDMKYIRSKNMVKNSCVLINFPLYERQYYKFDSSKYTHPIRPHQIDGVRVIIYFIENNDTLLNLNIGTREHTRIKDFKDWVLFSETYHMFGLFERLNMEELFNKRSMTYEIREYIEALKK